MLAVFLTFASIVLPFSFRMRCAGNFIGTGARTRKRDQLEEGEEELEEEQRRALESPQDGPSRLRSESQESNNLRNSMISPSMPSNHPSSQFSFSSPIDARSPGTTTERSIVSKGLSHSSASLNSYVSLSPMDLISSKEIFARPSSSSSSSRSRDLSQPYYCPFPDCLASFRLPEELGRHAQSHPSRGREEAQARERLQDPTKRRPHWDGEQEQRRNEGGHARIPNFESPSSFANHSFLPPPHRLSKDSRRSLQLIQPLNRIIKIQVKGRDLTQILQNHPN